MAEAIIMPRQGQSVESCIFSEWFVKKGERVSKGDLLFAYETDKAAFEQEATADGILLATLAEEGDEIPVLDIVGVIGEEGESIDAFLPGGKASVEVADTQVEEVPKANDEKPVAEIVSKSSASESMISPRAKHLAAKEQLTFEGLSGTGPNNRIIERDIQAAIQSRPKATPLARAIAAEEKIQLPSVGSGIGGKVLAADVKQMPSITFADDYTDKKISNMRKIIAQNMYEWKSVV